MVERKQGASQIHHGQKYNHYDKEGELYTLLGKCIFCRLAAGKMPEYLLYEDEHVVIFADLKQKARVHLQCVPKRHIKDWTCLKTGDIPLLQHMHETALKYLQEKYPGCEYAFGFHSPGSNSKFHLHMHSLVLPLNNPKHERRYVGTGIAKVEYVLQQLLKRVELESEKQK